MTAKLAQITQCVNALTEELPELDTTMFKLCGVKIDPKVTLSGYNIPGLTTLKNLASKQIILKPFLPTITKHLKSLKDGEHLKKKKTVQTTIPQTIKKSLPKAVTFAPSAAAESLKRKLMGGADKVEIVKKRKVASTSKIFGNVRRKLFWTNYSMWVPTEVTPNGKVELLCYCAKPAIVTSSAFNPGESLFVCSKSKNKCNFQFTEFSGELLLQFMEKHQIGYIPRPVCNCYMDDKKTFQYCHVRGSPGEIDNPKLWYKCVLCGSVFYFNDYVQDIKETVANRLKEEEETLRKEQEHEERIAKLREEEEEEQQQEPQQEEIEVEEEDEEHVDDPPSDES